MQSYLQPGNSGKQIWQMFRNNTTRGNHPYNFTGFCMALVIQWLLEIKFSDGANPIDLARHILNADLGRHGYGGISSSQNIYSNENDATMINRHSGGALAHANLQTRHSSQAHWLLIRSRAYNIPEDNSIRFQDRSINYSGLIGLSGRNGFLTRLLLGNGWAHAIGFHSDQNNIYIFDPNYGIFTFPQRNQGTVSQFITDMWIQYGATAGELADIA